MKYQNILFVVFLSLFSVSCILKNNRFENGVNAILGDESYTQSFGCEPTSRTNETVRIQTHLKFVEEMLRNRPVVSLTEDQIEKRMHALDLLNEYWTSAVFPKNYDYPEQRIPCFIDKNGNICAVGYLIEKTTDRQVAENINSKYKYDYLMDIDDATINSWMETNGLTKEECAMIQPAYFPQEQENTISKNYAISSAVVGGLNLSFSAINSIQLAQRQNNNLVAPIAGLVSGASQLFIGAFNYPEEQMIWGQTYINTAERNVSLLNIGLGTTTMLLSGWNLLRDRKPKTKRLAWNVYSFPTKESQVGLGFSLTKKL